MNNRIMYWIAILVLLASSLACQITIGGVGGSTRGSGNVIEEERPISGVTSVMVSNQGDLTVEIGDEERLVIEAEDNLLQYIETTVSSARLEIGTQRGMDLRNTKPIRYHLTVKSLKGLASSSSGDINALQVSADNFSIEVSSSGEIQVDSLGAGSLGVKISSSGNVSIASGTVDEQIINISSSGSYNAAELQSRVASVEVSSSGNAEIKVSDRLQANLSSSGDVIYYGDPDVDARESSSGDVVKGD